MVASADHQLFTTEFSVALGGLEPVVPGHTLVTPLRSAGRLPLLEKVELVDLWRAVRMALQAGEDREAPEAFNVAVNDGAAAGQPVPQLHVHVVPRRTGDFAENDEVYGALERWRPPAESDPESFSAIADVEWPEDAQRRPRTAAEMAAEAELYRQTAAAAGIASGALPEEHIFARFPITQASLFHASASGLSLAFVNLKPLLPGHVLVTSRRVAPRIADLSDEEFDDLFLTVRDVQAVVERHYGAAASRIGIQDGSVAGQSVPHVHVHVLPMPGLRKHATPASAAM